MNRQICKVKISIGFGKTEPKVWKKGEGKNMYEAIQDLFNRQHNYIQAHHMSAVGSEILKTYNKMFKRKE